MDWKDFFRKNINKLLIALIAGIAVFAGLYFQIFLTQAITDNKFSNINVVNIVQSQFESNDTEETETAELTEPVEPKIQAGTLKQRLDQLNSDEDKISLSNQKSDEASTLHGKGDYDGAIKLYNKAIVLNPNNYVAYFRRGNVYYSQQKYVRAIVDYNKAIQLNPNYAEAFNNRGTAFHSQQQYARAIIDYDNSIRLNPNHSEVYNNRGTAYQLLRQYDRAISDFDKALELNPNNESAKINRKRLRDTLGR